MKTGSFIFIFEDGSSRHMQGVTDADLQAVEEGVLEVIDISSPFYPLTYYDGGWNQLSTENPFEEEE